MNNRKYYILLIVLIITLAFSGCSDKEISAYQISMPQDSLEEVKHNIDYAFSDKRPYVLYEDKNADKTFTVNFDGKDYVGTYESSAYYSYNTYVTHNYRFEGGKFEINGRTNNLENITIFENGKVTDGSATIDECREKANKIFKQYIEINDYEVTEDDTAYYIFACQKYISGIATNQRISILFAKNGEIASFSCSDMDNIPTNTKTQQRVELLASEKGLREVENKISTIYANSKIDYEYEIKDKLVVKTKEGDIGVIYFVSIKEEVQPNEEGRYLGGLHDIKILVK